MSYSTKEEVRKMLKDDALNAIIGDTFIEDPAEREELVEPLIEAAIADADAEIDGYLAKRYTVPISPAPRVLLYLHRVDIISLTSSRTFPYNTFFLYLGMNTI